MKKILSQINLCGFNAFFEIVKFSLVVVLLLVFAIFVIVFDLPYIYIGYGLSLFVSFSLIYFGRYGSIIRKNKILIEEEFVSVFTYFGIYISNGFNVYQSLLNVKNFCSEKLNKYLEILLREIDIDKTVQPFINFSAYFENVSIKEVLLSIYQMIDEGNGGNYVKQYESLFAKFSDSKYKEIAEKRRNLLSGLTVLPLVGSAILMIILTISLVQIMGSYLSVI